jgi:hypothetical protein
VSVGFVEMAFSFFLTPADVQPRLRPSRAIPAIAPQTGITRGAIMNTVLLKRNGESVE